VRQFGGHSTAALICIYDGNVSEDPHVSDDKITFQPNYFSSVSPGMLSPDFDDDDDGAGVDGDNDVSEFFNSKDLVTVIPERDL
jgi:hypothetical protein